MKITNNQNVPYTNSVTNKGLNQKANKMQLEKQNFDSVTIKSNPEEILKKKFLETTTTKMKQALRKPTSPDRIQELKEQIKNGTYKVDASKIAENMILLGKEHDIE